MLLRWVFKVTLFNFKFSFESEQMLLILGYMWQLWSFRIRTWHIPAINSHCLIDVWSKKDLGRSLACVRSWPDNRAFQHLDHQLMWYCRWTGQPAMYELPYWFVSTLKDSSFYIKADYNLRVVISPALPPSCQVIHGIVRVARAKSFLGISLFKEISLIYLLLI